MTTTPHTPPNSRACGAGASSLRPERRISGVRFFRGYGGGSVPRSGYLDREDKMSIEPTFIAIWVVIGIVLGGIASFIVKSGTLGLVGDAIVGLVGGLIAGYVLPRVGVYIGAGFVPEVINAVIGAVVLLVVARLAKTVF